jgi:phosphotransferase system IIB component
MSSHFRLKQHINNSWRASQIAEDVRTLIEENEKYKQAYTSLRSCQFIAGVKEVNSLASKIKQLIEESKALEQILNAENKTEALKVLEKVKKERELEKD